MRPGALVDALGPKNGEGCPGRWSDLRPWFEEGIGGAAVPLRGPGYRAEEQGARSAAGASEVRIHAVLTRSAFDYGSRCWELAGLATGRSDGRFASASLWPHDWAVLLHREGCRARDRSHREAGLDARYAR